MKLIPIAILSGAAIVTAVTVAPRLSASLQSHEYASGQCRAVDGDTLRCGTERIRLLEIDSPEMPGHCRKGRVCAPGDPFAAKKSMADFISGQNLVVRVYAVDLYGRDVADVRVNDESASCHQIRTGNAIRQLKWADYGVTTAECP